MATELDIINLARFRGGKGEISESDLKSQTFVYDLILGDLLEEREWLFTLAVSNNLILTKPAIDLGYKFVYSLGDNNVENVEAINFSSSIDLASLSVRRAVEYGLAVDPIGESPRVSSKEFLFVNGLLHTNTEVKTVVYKRNVKPVNMPDSFRNLLAWCLAEHYAMTPGKDLERIDNIRREKKMAHRRATRFESRNTNDPQLESIRKFRQQYRKSTYSRGY